MTLIREATKTSPLPADAIPFGRTGGTIPRYMEAGALTGLTGYGFLNAATSAGATSATLKGVPAWLSANAAWLLLDPGTVEAEIRKVTAVSGNALTVSALSFAHAANDAALVIPDAIFNVMYFGAKGDGSTDDRTAIQAALDAANNAGGGTVVLPPGIYDMTRGSGNFILNLTNFNNVRIIGSGIDRTIIRWRPNIAWTGDTHTFWVRDAQNIHFSDFTIDGSYGVGTTTFSDEQKHGIRFEANNEDVEYIHIERVKFHRLRGDGVYLLGNSPYWCQKFWLQECQAIGNGRAGFILNGARKVWIKRNYFKDMTNGQWLDCEGTRVQDIVVAFNYADWANDVAGVQFAGSSGSVPQTGIKFLYNTMTGGGLILIHVTDSQFIGNTITGTTTRRPFTATGKIEDVLISHNTFTDTYGESGMYFAQSSGQSNGVEICHNNIELAGTAGLGDPNGITIYRGTRFHVHHNHIIQTGSGNHRGIAFVSVGASEAYTDIILENNEFRDLSIGLLLQPRTSSTIAGLRIANNRFYTVTTAVFLDASGYNFMAAGSDFYYKDNIFNGVTTKLNNDSNVVYWKTGQNEWEGNGSPEGVVTAPVGDKYWRIDGGAGQWLYKKATGTGNTGWTAIG